jgi:hypothetical protein
MTQSIFNTTSVQVYYHPDVFNRKSVAAIAGTGGIGVAACAANLFYERDSLSSNCPSALFYGGAALMTLGAVISVGLTCQYFYVRRAMKNAMENDFNRAGNWWASSFKDLEVSTDNPAQYTVEEFAEPRPHIAGFVMQTSQAHGSAIHVFRTDEQENEHLAKLQSENYKYVDDKVERGNWTLRFANFILECEGI